MSYRAFLLAVVWMMAGVSPALSQNFVFTAIPDQDETMLKTRFGKVADYFSKQLSVPVQYIPVKSYQAAVTAFRNGQVQLAWFGGLTGVQARMLVPGAQAIAQGVEDKAFKSYFIAHASTGLRRDSKLPDSVAGMTFTFGSKDSTSGRLMPEFYLRERFGKTPEEVFRRVGFSGDHSRTIALVQSGAFQIGVVNYAVWSQEQEEGNIDISKVSVIWETPEYPDYNWTIRGDVDRRFGPGFTEKVTKAILGMKDPELLKTFPRETGFIPAKNDDYGPIEAVGKQIGLLE